MKLLSIVLKSKLINCDTDFKSYRSALQQTQKSSERHSKHTVQQGQIKSKTKYSEAKCEETGTIFVKHQEVLIR